MPNEQMNVPNSEIIKAKMEKLQHELDAALILEGKRSVLTEVEKRLLEKIPNCKDIDYILWPLRVSEGETSTRRYSVPRVRNEWNQERDALVDAGAFDELMKLGFTMPAIRSRANRLGYSIHGNSIVKKDPV